MRRICHHKRRTKHSTESEYRITIIIIFVRSLKKMIAAGRRAAPVDHWPVAKRREELVRNQPEPSLAFSIMQIFTSNNTDPPFRANRAASQTKLIAVREKIRNGNSDIEFSSTHSLRGDYLVVVVTSRVAKLTALALLGWLLFKWRRLCIAKLCTDPPLLGSQPQLHLHPILPVYHKWASISLDGFFFCFCFEMKSLCLYTQKDTHFV